MTVAGRLAAAGLVAVLVACSASPSPTPPPCPTQAPTLASAQATLEDAQIATVSVSGAVEGEFSMELYGDDAPLATANFVALARCGFYDGQWFHRILAGFVIQVGDPGTRTHDGDWPDLGRGGPGYGFEIEPPAAGLRYDPYSVAMANNSVANGSQWFVSLTDLDEQLRAVGIYTIFGAVVEGKDVIDKIAAVPVNDPEVGVPLEQVTIEHVQISSRSGTQASDG
jgi:dolichyl-diphosphooligosaccharide--protein glycosyltransferase